MGLINETNGKKEEGSVIPKKTFKMGTVQIGRIHMEYMEALYQVFLGFQSNMIPVWLEACRSVYFSWEFGISVWDFGFSVEDTGFLGFLSHFRAASLILGLSLMI